MFIRLIFFSVLIVAVTFVFLGGHLYSQPIQAAIDQYGVAYTGYSQATNNGEQMDLFNKTWDKIYVVTKRYFVELEFDRFIYRLTGILFLLAGFTICTAFVIVILLALFQVLNYAKHVRAIRTMKQLDTQIQAVQQQISDMERHNRTTR